MITALCNGQIFNGETLLPDCAVLISGNRIVDVCLQGDIPAHVEKRLDLVGGTLLPGFIDVQVNGGGGVLFNDAPSVDAIRRIGEAHNCYGTTGFLPTLISDDPEVMEAGILAVAQALEQGLPGVLGIHLEGPFINPLRKGVHDESKFRSLDDASYKLLTSLNNGITLITIAPELCTARMIERLVGAGLKVCAGHSDASYDETCSALAAGLHGFTHVFNAMTPLTSRSPGMLGAALDDRNSYCGIIVDGHHVHPASLRVAVAAKPRGKMMLVTDAMPTVGSDQDSFLLNGELIHSVNGRCATAEGTLAGSDLNMFTALRNCVELLELPWQEAARMASTYPATFLGLEQELGYIKAGYRANMVLVDQEFGFLGSWIDGLGGPALSTC
jgi:N-acetylglucosamine-6-phosphate deacetylase